MSESFIFISNWTQGNGLSGGDKIWIELAKSWKSRFSVSVIGSQEAVNIAEREGLRGVEYIQSMPQIDGKNNLSVLSLIKNIFVRSFRAASFVLRSKKLLNLNPQFIYSVSDFWPDSLAAFLLKKKYPQAKWIAGFYLFAPKPWAVDSPYKGINFIKGFFYFLIQWPIFCLVKKYADYVFVTSEPDVDKFITPKRKRDKIVVVQGGVDMSEVRQFAMPDKDKAKRKYEACFMGRLHYQKGVLVLVDIWAVLVKTIPEAKLAIIGDGEMEKALEEKIDKLNLKGNITLLGFMGGQKKFNVFNDSKVVVHPAIYDSGGMAAVEAMASGLPGVSFDLEALKTYYPKGMVKTPCFDVKKFAANIILLLQDSKLYEGIKKEAIEEAQKWDWEKRSDKVLGQLLQKSMKKELNA